MFKVLFAALAVTFVFGASAEAQQPSVVCSSRQANDPCVYRCWFDENARYCETVVGGRQCTPPNPKSFRYTGGKVGVMNFWNSQPLLCEVGAGF